MMKNLVCAICNRKPESLTEDFCVHDFSLSPSKRVEIYYCLFCYREYPDVIEKFYEKFKKTFDETSTISKTNTVSSFKVECQILADKFIKQIEEITSKYEKTHKNFE